MMAVAAAQKNREMFAIKKSYSIEVSSLNSVKERVEKTMYMTYYDALRLNVDIF